MTLPVVLRDLDTQLAGLRAELDKVRWERDQLIDQHATVQELQAEVEKLTGQLYAARDEVKNVNLALAQAQAKNRSRGW